MKLSIISDSFGVPLNIFFNKGNLHDFTIFLKQVENFKFIDSNHLIFMADSGYDSSKIRSFLNDKFKKVIIPYNVRNTKYISKIKNLTKIDKELYKKRIKIEHINSRIKSYKRLQNLYE